MKRIIVIVLAMVMVLSFAACGETATVTDEGKKGDYEKKSVNN